MGAHRRLGSTAILGNIKPWTSAKIHFNSAIGLLRKNRGQPGSLSGEQMVNQAAIAPVRHACLRGAW